MNKKSAIIFLIFCTVMLFLFTLDYKKINLSEITKESFTNNKIQKQIIDQVSKTEALKIEDVPKFATQTEKKIDTKKYNNCGESIPVLIPGFIVKINQSSIVIDINQGAYNENKKIDVDDNTDIVKIKLSDSGEIKSEDKINFNDLKVGVDVVATVVETKENILIAQKIKYLLFE